MEVDCQIPLSRLNSNNTNTIIELTSDDEVKPLKPKFTPTIQKYKAPAVVKPIQQAEGSKPKPRPAEAL